MVFKLLCGRRLNRLFPAGAFAALLGLSLLSSQAAALSVGRIQVSSFLNEPFRATVPLSSVEPGEVEQLRIRLADDNAYATLGLEKSRFLTTLQFSAREGSEPGSAIVAISSQQVAKEPFFSFLLEFRGLGGRIIREYTVLLDPNTGQRQQAREQAVAASTVVVNSASSTPIALANRRASVQAAAEDDSFEEMQELPMDLPREVPAPAQPVERAAPPRQDLVQAFESGAKERQVQVPSPQFIAGTQPVVDATRSAVAPSAQAPQPVTASKNNQYGPVPAGMTLWQIAAAVRPSASLTLNQVMWGLYSVNEKQFDGNLNLVRRGAVLTVPSEQAMRNVSPGEAAALVADQADQFKQRGQQARVDQPRLRASAPEQLAVEAAPQLQLDSRILAPAATASTANVDPSPLEKAPVAAIQEPQVRPVEVVEEQELQALPADDGFEELEELPLGEATLAEASDDYADLPPLPEDEGSEGSAEFEDAEAAGGFDASNDSAPESGGLLGWLLAGLGVIAAALLAMFALRKRGQSDATETVSDFASGHVPSEAASVSDYASDSSDVKTKEFPAVSVDQPADVATPEEADFEMPDLDTLAAVDDHDGADFGDTAVFDAAQDELIPAEVDFGDTEISQAVPAEEPNEVDAGPMTLDLPDDIAADDLGGATQTLDLGSETVSLELNEDPVSEADFQLAYGLYDEAALLLNRAIENDPDRLELHEKLAETYFASSDATNFKLAAEKLKSKAPDAETWQRIAIMGQQLCPGDGLFSGDLADDLGAAVDLDMAFDGGDDVAHVEESTALDFDMPISEQADAPAEASEETNVLEFELEDETAPGDAAQSSNDVELDDFDADFASLEASDDANVDLPELGDLDLGDLEAELDSDEEAAEVADFEAETVIMEAAPELAPAADVVEEQTSDDFADLTLSDISDTELGLDDDSGDASDVLGVGTDFDLADDLTVDGSEESSELTLSDDALELDSTSDELSLDDLELDLDTASDAQATDFDLADLGDEAATDFDLGDLSSDDLGTDATELNLDDLAADSSADFDLGELDEAAASGLETDFDLASLDSEESSTELGAATDFDLENPVGEVPDLSTAEDTDFDLADLGEGTDLDLSDNADAGDISGGDEAGTKLDLARAYVDMGEADMARSLLDEVAQSGSDAQKAEAQELLGKL